MKNQIRRIAPDVNQISLAPREMSQERESGSRWRSNFYVWQIDKLRGRTQNQLKPM